MQEIQMGVYRLYHSERDISYIGFSRNLAGTKKRLRFELKLNACSYKPLQAFYNECGGDLTYEVLETYVPAEGMSEEEIDAHLQAILLRYQVKLKARPVQVQI
ncbi:hypothetical protein LJC07_06430 [Christensenellaceae bacterium OttesenSCG-928-L17]|nr:hypothetical protein [Christensenellaceae bacterium OttesenSCG-928-L17]